MPVFYLLDGVLVVVRRHGDVSAVDDLEARHEGVDRERDIVPAVKRQATGPRANTGGPKPRTRAVGRTSVEGRSDECDIECLVLVFAKALDPRQSCKCGDPREDRISGHCNDDIKLQVYQPSWGVPVLSPG